MIVTANITMASVLSHLKQINPAMMPAGIRKTANALMVKSTDLVFHAQWAGTEHSLRFMDTETDGTMVAIVRPPQAKDIRGDERYDHPEAIVVEYLYLTAEDRRRLKEAL